MPLISLLLDGNKPADVRNELALYKERGTVVYEKVLAIPNNERIPTLVKDNESRYKVLMALTASLKSAFNNLSLKYPLNEDQTVELADKIIDESFEDNLSIQDVLLFLSDLLTGKMGEVEYKLDMPTFFKKFEKYRQNRHTEILRIRDEQQSNFKAMGKGNVKPEVEIERGKIDANTFFDLLQTFNEGKNDV